MPESGTGTFLAVGWCPFQCPPHRFRAAGFPPTGRPRSRTRRYPGHRRVRADICVPDPEQGPAPPNPRSETAARCSVQIHCRPATSSWQRWPAVSGALELTAMWVRGQLDITREHLTEFITSAIVTVATDMTRPERS